ncbi:hypothetical protein INR49_018053 [Caranx melampygus]|nr:hypothetical protein INR49_018053 [Caranx melampygus]
MALPPQFKPIQHHLRTAQEHEKRDPVVAYYCRLYAMQTGMKLDSKTPDCRKFLVKLMDQLESVVQVSDKDAEPGHVPCEFLQMKKELSDNESISQEVVGNAHIENYALKMFLYADNEDRAGRFHKNMIKSFYTASLLLDVLSVFGELSEENIQHRKYARWKATYIHNCLKNGETPQAGPIAMDEDEEAVIDQLIGYSRNHEVKEALSQLQGFDWFMCFSAVNENRTTNVENVEKTRRYEFGAQGFSGPGPSSSGSFRGPPPSQTYEDQDQDQDQDKSLGPGPAPGIGFTPGPGSGPSGPPTTNYNNIHIPPGAHAPANTPAELPPPTAEAVKPVPTPRTLPAVDPTLLNAQQQAVTCRWIRYGGRVLTRSEAHVVFAEQSEEGWFKLESPPGTDRQMDEEREGGRNERPSDGGEERMMEEEKRWMSATVQFVAAGLKGPLTPTPPPPNRPPTPVYDEASGVQLGPEDFTKAQKYCKYAGSALQYEDVGTAIQNLQKALKLLTTGKE